MRHKSNVDQLNKSLSHSLEIKFYRLTSTQVGPLTFHGQCEEEEENEEGKIFHSMSPLGTRVWLKGQGLQCTWKLVCLMADKGRQFVQLFGKNKMTTACSTGRPWAGGKRKKFR